MKLSWTRLALADRLAIRNTIGKDDAMAALALDARFSAQARLLLEQPGLGRPGRVPDTRELVAHPNYILVYDVAGEVVRVVRVLHVARLWPPVT